MYDPRPMADLDETGAIDWLLIEAPDKTINGELVPPLLDLVNRRLIRILDVLILLKRTDDDFDMLTTADLDEAQVGELGELAGASSGLLSTTTPRPQCRRCNPTTSGC